MAEDALSEAPTVSMHSCPQISPQEWDCGCVTAIYVTDADMFNGGEPFEMRVARRCGKRTCCLRWEISPSINAVYRSVANTTGRRWRATCWAFGDRQMTLVPLGGDWGSGGGVKAITVPWDRLYNPRLWGRVR